MASPKDARKFALDAIARVCRLGAEAAEPDVKRRQELIMQYSKAVRKPFLDASSELFRVHARICRADHS